jgi:iron complex outermembrane receptor protein
MRVATIGKALSASVSVVALALGAPAMAQAPGEDADEAIVVFGKGETRQVQEVAPTSSVLTPGTSPIRAIEKLPSVNIQAADPFGNYEWSTRVTIRSFNQNQLGFNFDGIPLGDMSYGNHNGLHISRIVSPENIGSVRVSQGAGSLGTQSTNNLGGTVETFSMRPANPVSARQANATYGSDDTMRGLRARLNFGSEDGLRGFVSYGYGSTDKYKGTGTQDQHMVNAKAVLPLGEAKVDGWFSYSDRREQDYQDMSLDMLARLGYGWDNTYPDYAWRCSLPISATTAAIPARRSSNAAAGTVYPGNCHFGRRCLLRRFGPAQGHRRRAGLQSPLGEQRKSR